MSPSSGRLPGVPDPSYVAVDVQYHSDGTASAARVTYSDLRFSDLTECAVVDVPEALPYVPGAFFERELPALRPLIDARPWPDLLVIDGYVDLDPDGRPGLGAHVHEAYPIPVIGVAKTAFRAATHAIPVTRGESAKPLLVTAIGLDRARAADLVAGMVGRYRMPDALRLVDALARRNITPAEAAR